MFIWLSLGFGKQRRVVVGLHKQADKLFCVSGAIFALMLREAFA